MPKRKFRRGYERATPGYGSSPGFTTRTRTGVTPAGRKYTATRVRKANATETKIGKITELQVNSSISYAKTTGTGSGYLKKGVHKVRYTTSRSGAKVVEPYTKAPLGIAIKKKK